MSTYIVSIFGTEAQANDAVHAFDALHMEGSITLYETTVVQRGADGTLDVKGRGGAAIATTGLEDVTNQMKPGDFAVLAEVSEQWTAPIDTRMQALGGTVLRSHYVDDLIAKRAVAHEAEGDRRKTEHASHKAQRMESRLEHNIAKARERFERFAAKARDRVDTTKVELEQKLAALQVQAEDATPEVKDQIDARIAELRDEFAARERKLNHAFELAAEALHP